jgi:hypothetical protein
LFSAHSYPPQRSLTFKDVGIILCVGIGLQSIPVIFLERAADKASIPIKLMQPCVESVFRQNGLHITDNRTPASHGIIAGELSGDKKILATYEPGNVELITTVGVLGDEYDAVVRKVGIGLRECLREAAIPR